MSPEGGRAPGDGRARADDEPGMPSAHRVEISGSAPWDAASAEVAPRTPLPAAQEAATEAPAAAVIPRHGAGASEDDFVPAGAPRAEIEPSEPAPESASAALVESAPEEPSDAASPTPTAGLIESRAPAPWEVPVSGPTVVDPDVGTDGVSEDATDRASAAMGAATADGRARLDDSSAAVPDRPGDVAVEATTRPARKRLVDATQPVFGERTTAVTAAQANRLRLRRDALAALLLFGLLGVLALLFVSLAGSRSTPVATPPVAPGGVPGPTASSAAVLSLPPTSSPSLRTSPSATGPASGRPTSTAGSPASSVTPPATTPTSAPPEPSPTAPPTPPAPALVLVANGTTCSDVDPAWGSLLVPGLALGNGTFSNGVRQVTISGFTGRAFDFQAPAPIHGLIVRAGSQTGLYRFDPPATSGQHLSGPGGATINDLAFCAAG